MTAPGGSSVDMRFASDRFWRSLDDTSPDCVLIVDIAGIVQFANANALKMFGSGDDGDLVGADWLTSWAEPDRLLARGALDAAAHGEAGRFVATVWFDGERRRLDAILSPMPNNARAAGGVRVTCRDVTAIDDARVAAEARERAAAQEGELLRAAAEMASLTTWEFDFRRNRITVDEPGVRAMRGGPQHREITLEQALAMHTPENQALNLALIERACVHGEPYRVDLPITRHDGTRGWTRQFAQPMYEDGACIGIRGAGVDITDQVEAREAITRTEQRLNLAIQLAGMEVYELDFDNEVLLSDGGVSAIFQRPLRYEDMWPDPFVLVDPRDHARVHSDWLRAAKGHAPFRCEFRVRGCDDQEIWIYGVAEVVQGTERPNRLVTAIMDITARKRSELKILQTMAEMREHEARQKLLLDELNHRVKNTLAAVQSVAVQTLSGVRDLQEGRDLFVDRLLALSNTHNLLVKHAWTGASFTELTETVLKPYGRAYSYEGPDLRLDPNFAVSLGMALHELATNALKYGAWREDGQIAIVTAADEAEVRITWRESGGPSVSPPTRRGFGSRLLERGLAGEISARITLEFPPEGVVCSIHAPTSARLRAAAA